MAMLVCAASIASWTTAGIFFSLVFNTIEFFAYPASDFFFGMTWSPEFPWRFLLGIPLLWATFYIPSHRAAGRRADRAVCGDLSLGVCQPGHSVCCQAAA